MQVQRRLTTKDLDDAQIGYEKKYDVPELAIWLVLLPKTIFRSLVFAQAGNLISDGFTLNIIRGFLISSLNSFAILLVSARMVISQMRLIFPTHEVS